MSGIAGIVNFDSRPVDQSILHAMVDRLAVRGPDGSQVQGGGEGAAMAHTMLHTTPESLKENLPIIDKDAGLMMTADARIDNRDELFSSLGISGQQKGEISDSELIVKAYKKWGEGCSVKLCGDFTFAIWDSAKRRLFCARDHMGVKPFYYYCNGKFIIFASEIKALFCSPDVPHAVNSIRVYDYLAFYHGERNNTFYSDIYSLPAASSMLVENGTCNFTHYWDLSQKETCFRKDEEYRDAFLDLFSTAVECRTRSVYPVGASLSGGLDSSSIVCVARNKLQQNGEKLHTFSAIFPGLPVEQLQLCDEREYISAVVSQGGLESHFINADDSGPFTDFQRNQAHFDGVVSPYNRYIHSAMYQDAKRNGVRIFLDGIDGDTTVSHGYERLSELGKEWRFLTLFREAKALAVRQNVRFDKKSFVWNYIVRPRFSQSWVDFINHLIGRKVDDDLKCRMFNGNFPQGYWQTRERTIQGCDNTFTNARESHSMSLMAPLHQYVMETLDSAASLYGIEARYPYWDRRLMEFCVSVPASQKLHNGWNRAIQRSALQSILPPKVCMRIGKADLSPNFYNKLSESWQEIVERVIVSDEGKVSDFIELGLFKKLWEKCKDDPWGNVKETLLVYRVLTLALWLKASGFS